MWTTFTTTVRTLLHTPSAVVWTLIFPIVLATVLNFMFEPLRAQESVEAIDVAVVDDDAWRASPFSQVIDALATQDEPLLRAIPVDSTKDARSLVKDGQADGAFSVQSNGEPLLASPRRTQAATHPITSTAPSWSPSLPATCKTKAWLQT